MTCRAEGGVTEYGEMSARLVLARVRHTGLSQFSSDNLARIVDSAKHVSRYAKTKHIPAKRHLLRVWLSLDNCPVFTPFASLTSSLIRCPLVSSKLVSVVLGAVNLEYRLAELGFLSVAATR